jgi:arylsulfatase A-like enzyme
MLALSVTLFAGQSQASGKQSSRGKKPNVLFISVDDLNDWIGALGGHPDVKTPNIDRLARRGLLFRRAYAAAPVCNPSRTALLTGIRPSTSGVYNNDQPWRPVMPRAVTLTQHFMRNGYRVVGGGKIYHRRYDEDAGWHSYFTGASDPSPPREVFNDPRNRGGGLKWAALDVGDEAMSDYRVASWAADFMKQKHDEPFFLACGIFKPHLPWQVPKKYFDLYPLDKISLPKVLEDDLKDVPPAGVAMAQPHDDHAAIIKSGNWRRAVQAYLACISFADAQVGRVLDALDASEYRDNTIIVLWGDHGWHLGEKQHWRKFALWEAATRTPLILVAPGLTKPGSASDRPVELTHVYPTLADLCGLPAPEQLDGVSLRPLLLNPRAKWGRPAVTTHGRGNHAVRTERWRYIRYADGSEELYDHASDPLEWKNLATDPARAKTKAELSAWLPKVNAPDAPKAGKAGKGEGDEN